MSVEPNAIRDLIITTNVGPSNINGSSMYAIPYLLLTAPGENEENISFNYYMELPRAALNEDAKMQT